MFDTRDSNNEQSNHHHLSQLVAFLGPPPSALLQRSPVADEYFDQRGQYYHHPMRLATDCLEATFLEPLSFQASPLKNPKKTLKDPTKNCSSPSSERCCNGAPRIDRLLRNY